MVTWELRPGEAYTRAIKAPRPRYLRDREGWERRSIEAEYAVHGFLPAQAQNAVSGPDSRHLTAGRGLIVRPWRHTSSRPAGSDPYPTAR